MYERIHAKQAFSKKKRKEKEKKNYLLASYTSEYRYDLKATAHTVSDCDFKLQEMKCGIVGVWIESLSMCLFLSFLALFFAKYNQLNDAIKETLGNIEHQKYIKVQY